MYPGNWGNSGLEAQPQWNGPKIESNRVQSRFLRPPSSAYSAAVNRPFVNSPPMPSYLPTAMNPMQQWRFPFEMGTGPPPSFMPPWWFAVGGHRYTSPSFYPPFGGRYHQGTSAVSTPPQYGYPNEMNMGEQYGHNSLRPSSPPCTCPNQQTSTPSSHGGSQMGDYAPPPNTYFNMSTADGFANRTGMPIRPPTEPHQIKIDADCYKEGAVQSTDDKKCGRMNSDVSSAPTEKEKWRWLINNCAERGGDFDEFGWALSQPYLRKIKRIAPPSKQSVNCTLCAKKCCSSYRLRSHLYCFHLGVVRKIYRYICDDCGDVSGSYDWFWTHRKTHSVTDRVGKVQPYFDRMMKGAPLRKDGQTFRFGAAKKHSNDAPTLREFWRKYEDKEMPHRCILCFRVYGDTRRLRYHYCSVHLAAVRKVYRYECRTAGCKKLSGDVNWRFKHQKEGHMVIDRIDDIRSDIELMLSGAALPEDKPRVPPQQWVLTEGDRHKETDIVSGASSSVVVSAKKRKIVRQTPSISDSSDDD